MRIPAPIFRLSHFASLASLLALAPLLLPSTTTHDAGESRKAGISAIAWSLVALAVIAASLVVSKRAAYLAAGLAAGIFFCHAASPAAAAEIFSSVPMLIPACTSPLPGTHWS